MKQEQPRLAALLITPSYLAQKPLPPVPTMYGSFLHATKVTLTRFIGLAQLVDIKCATRGMSTAKLRKILATPGKHVGFRECLDIMISIWESKRGTKGMVSPAREVMSMETRGSDLEQGGERVNNNNSKRRNWGIFTGFMGVAMMSVGFVAGALTNFSCCQKSETGMEE
jgi:hypothetical protein